MIKFFRKIRKKLLTENKFSKYLFYAFGEIVLVVIGILIALQINNWNVDRIRNEKEVFNLIELKRSLENDMNAEIKPSIEWFEHRYEVTNVLIDEFNNPNLTISLDSVETIDSWYFNFIIRNSYIKL